MAKCANHPDRDAVQTGVFGGKFGDYCQECVRNAGRSAAGQSAQWHRDRDHEDHRRDLIQPKDGKTGKINPEFVRNYPEESKEMFTQDDINDALHQT